MTICLATICPALRRALVSIVLVGCSAAAVAPEPEAPRAPVAPITNLATEDAEILKMLSPNVLCGRVDQTCPKAEIHSFEPNELPFTPDVQALRESLDSLPFYAVILETQPAAPDDGNIGLEVEPTRACGGFFSEAARLEAQKHFGALRVFASHHGCSQSRVGYAGIARSENVLAVFAGDSEQEARATLEAARSRWPNAKLVRTQVQLLTFN
jgi:hypothetical protein